MYVENFTKFIEYYGKGRKIKLFGFFLLSIIAGALEFLGIALIYPFILLIIKPESVIHTKYYSDFANCFHVHNVLINAFILGFFVMCLFIIKNLFMIFCLLFPVYALSLQHNVNICNSPNLLLIINQQS